MDERSLYSHGVGAFLREFDIWELLGVQPLAEIQQQRLLKLILYSQLTLYVALDEDRQEVRSLHLAVFLGRIDRVINVVL